MSPTPDPRIRVLVIDDPIRPGDVPRLCECLRRLSGATEAEAIVCDVLGLPADAVTVDALARLQLTARRLGRRISLRRSSRELDALLAFLGLAETFAPGLRRGTGRETEEREEPRRVEE